MRDALRSKATYSLETKKMQQEEKQFPIPLISPEPPSSPEASSMSPNPQLSSPSSPEPVNTVQNGSIPTNGDSITSELPPPIENGLVPAVSEN